MSKRFGRNQRRRMRERIARLERTEEVLRSSLRREAERAREIDREKYVLDRMADEMVGAWSKELRPHAEKLLAEYNGRRVPRVSVREAFEPFGHATILTIDIPALCLSRIIPEY